MAASMLAFARGSRASSYLVLKLRPADVWFDVVELAKAAALFPLDLMSEHNRWAPRNNVHGVSSAFDTVAVPAERRRQQIKGIR